MCGMCCVVTYNLYVNASCHASCVGTMGHEPMETPAGKTSTLHVLHPGKQLALEEKGDPIQGRQLSAERCHITDGLSKFVEHATADETGVLVSLTAPGP